MDIKLNGDIIQTNAKTVEELLKETEQDLDAGGLAVAVNETVVSQTEWQDQSVQEGDRVEIIRATQGG